MSAEPLVVARGLSVAYARDAVLRGVDLEIREGERWFWIGPNGSGKTTLLRALLGLLEPSVGSLTLREDLRDARRLGFVPQRCDWTATLPTTVREFVSLGLVGTGLPAGQRSERLRWALERVELAERGSAQYTALSGGQRQRALVARALVRRPALLLLDEPTEELDVGSEAALLATLDGLQVEIGTTTVFVTHALGLARRYATHVALFHRGAVRAGARDEVLRSEQLERAFGATAADRAR